MNFSMSPEEGSDLSVLGLENKLKPVKTYEELEIEIGDNEILRETYKDMFNQCVKYAITVARYNQILSKINSEEGVDDELEKMEPIRTVVHNATIDSINIFSRQLAKSGKDNSWVGSFNGERTKYAKFALLFALDWLAKNPQ